MIVTAGTLAHLLRKDLMMKVPVGPSEEEVPERSLCVGVCLRVEKVKERRSDRSLAACFFIGVCVELPLPAAPG